VTPFDFDTCARATNDITILMGRVNELMERWPPAQNGHGCLAHPEQVLSDLQEAQQAIGAALATMGRTTFPTRADYEAAQRQAREKTLRHGRSS